MKKITYLLILFATFLIYSCSADDSTENDTSTETDNELQIRSWIQKEYTFYGSTGPVESGILADSLHFVIENNRIVSFSGLTDMDDTPKATSGDFTYENGRIAEIDRYTDGQLVLQINYMYDNSGELMESSSRYYDSDQSYSLYKREYSHTADTIYKTSYFSTDDIEFELLTSAKIVLDDNSNRVYFDDLEGITRSTYDTSGNMLSNSINNGSTRYNYTYSNAINSAALIYNRTVGKKVNMIEFNEGLAFSPSLISPNSMSAISATNDSNDYSFVIETDVNPENYTTRTYHKENVNGIGDDLVVSEFIFE